jgi:hypothetical protein
MMMTLDDDVHDYDYINNKTMKSKERERNEPGVFQFEVLT